MKKKTLYNASFEESNKIVSKDILTSDGTSTGKIGYVPFIKRALAIFPLMFLGIISIGIAVAMPQSLKNIKPSDIKTISVQSARLIGQIGEAIMPVAVAFLVLVGVLFILNLFPQKSYVQQMKMGSLIGIAMIITMILILIPMCFGLSIGETGWIGFIIQCVVGISLMAYVIVKRRLKIINALYGSGDTLNDPSTKVGTFLSGSSGILLLFVVLNRHFFHFGTVNSENSGFADFLMGWAVLILLLFCAGMAYLMMQKSVGAYYFIKYSEQYHKKFDVTDAQWYGKRRANKMMKKNKKI